MGEVENGKVGREARDAVGAQRPTTGENRVQAAMRQYLGAIAFHSRDKDQGKRRKPDVGPRGKG